MTPQERKLVDELFDRLRRWKTRRAIPTRSTPSIEGLDQAPNALYPLVQTVLVQDEALKRADARIRELEAELGIDQPQAQPQGGFLDNMRDALLGKPRAARLGAVGACRRESECVRHAARPTIRARRCSRSSRSNTDSLSMDSLSMASRAAAGGGSFLGTAAATAAGVVGGALLMNSFRGMFGGQQPGGQSHSAFDQPTGGAPWGAGNGSSSDLARQAGLDDIGSSGRERRLTTIGGSERAGLFDVGAERRPATDVRWRRRATRCRRRLRRRRRRLIACRRR